MTSEQGMQAMREWREFYGVGAQVAATLLGLLFVAIALNSDIILAGNRPQTKLRAEQAFQNYIAILVIALMFLIPKLNLDGLATILDGEAVTMVAFATYRLAKTTRLPEPGFPRMHHWRRLMPSLAAYCLMIYGGYHLSKATDTRALTYVGFATLLLMVSATITSWELLVRVAEIKHQNKSDALD